MKGLKDKVAIVTGGSSGIGLATALAFSREGTKVVVADIVAEDSQKAVTAIEQAGGSAIFVKTDVAISTEVQALIEKTVAVFGRLDFAVNNAGIGGASA